MVPSSQGSGSAAVVTDTVSAKTEMPSLSLRQRWLYSGLLLLAAYGLMAAINTLSLGFQALVTVPSQWLLPLATNPLAGLCVGLLLTGLLQSSSVVTSLIVAMGAAGLPLPIAVPMVMGANLGTTLTNTLVSLGYVSEAEDFERGFAAATLHDLLNLLSVLLLFPLEWIWHPLARLSIWASQGLAARLAQPPAGSIFDQLPSVPLLAILLWPVQWSVMQWVNRVPGPWDAVGLVLVSLALLMGSVTGAGWLVRRLLVGRAETIVHSIMGRGSALGLVTGTGLTAVLQSSSLTTSLLVPLAAAGRVTLAEVYPFVVGANIGTCGTALLAALATGDRSIALQVALVHVGFNLLGGLVIYSVPGLRQLPPRAAQWLAARVAPQRLWAIVYVLSVFFAIPALLLAASVWSLGI